MRERVQKSLMTALILSETSHVFCCVLPTVFTLFSLMVGMGIAASIPGPLVAIHEAIHHWEIPIIAFSGVILAFSWGITWYSDKLDCHHSGCSHDECAPRKNRAHMVLMIASALFLFNLTIYIFVHRAGIVPGQTGESHTHAEQPLHGDE